MKESQARAQENKARGRRSKEKMEGKQRAREGKQSLRPARFTFIFNMLASSNPASGLVESDEGVARALVCGIFQPNENTIARIL
jgi:hypothetical protein